MKEILDPIDVISLVSRTSTRGHDSTRWSKAVAMVERKTRQDVAHCRARAVNPVDEPFDPARHEAVGTEPAASPEEDGTVGRVYQIGYTFKGQLLRPARVVVRQYADAD